MDLDSMKYAELQKLAKDLGLKANMKADKLLKSIKQHQKELLQDRGVQDLVKDTTPAPENFTQEDAKEEETAEVSTGPAFVNTRRGKAVRTKRKITESAGPESNGEEDPTAPEEETAAAAGSAKRRRVSARTEEKSEATAANKEQQAENKASKDPKGGKIPRLQKKPVLKPVTPNFKKLHEAQFNKMESIDSYVQRKNKQMESYKTAVKELKLLSDQTKQQVKVKTEPKPKSTRTSLFSPAPTRKSQVEEKRRQTLLSASKAPPKKSVGKEDAAFKPTVLSTRRINVRFSEATKDNEYKKSLIKTPARMSPCVASSTPQEKAESVKPSAVKTTNLSALKTPGGPFVFTGNTSTSTTPGTQKKFDLKASLARPLGYMPHKGKLKPFGETTKENPAANKSLTTANVNSHQKNYKQHQVQTRGDRRAKHTEGRKQKKDNLLGARRGLVMM